MAVDRACSAIPEMSSIGHWCMSIRCEPIFAPQFVSIIAYCLTLASPTSLMILCDMPPQHVISNIYRLIFTQGLYAKCPRNDKLKISKVGLIIPRWNSTPCLCLPPFRRDEDIILMCPAQGCVVEKGGGGFWHSDTKSSTPSLRELRGL